MAIDPCTEYGLALAIEDFVPCVLAGAGLMVFARRTSHPMLATIGGLLVLVGGLSKATWKTLVAAEPCRNYELLEQVLFPCLSFGFALVLVAFLGKRWLLAIPAVAGVAALAVQAMWPCLIAAAIGAVTLGVAASRRAARDGDRVGAALFVVYVVGTLVLPPLAGRPDQSEGLQWIEQLTNTGVQGAFLLGALRLRPVSAAAITPAVSEGANA